MWNWCWEAGVELYELMPNPPGNLTRVSFSKISSTPDLRRQLAGTLCVSDSSRRSDLWALTDAACQQRNSLSSGETTTAAEAEAMNSGCQIASEFCLSSAKGQNLWTKTNLHGYQIRAATFSLVGASVQYHVCPIRTLCLLGSKLLELCLYEPCNMACM